MRTTAPASVRQNPAQPIRLPSFTIPAESKYKFPESDLAYISTETGVLVTRNHLLTAWIMQGHAGSRNNKRRCQFYDVALPTLTTDPQNRITGIMLDTICFESLPDAVNFVEKTLGSGGTAND